MALAVNVWVPDLKELATHPAYLPGDGLDLTNRPNVIDVWSGSGPGRSLLLNGHLDTISVEPAAAWTHAHLSGHEGMARSTGVAPRT
jgi:acetylornithine deacetylase